MSVHNPHDHFFRDSFGRPEIARSYLQEYLPADLVHLLDLDYLVLQEGSFIDESLREHQSDLLYRTTLRDNDFSYRSDEEIRGEIWLRVCLSVMRAIYHPGLKLARIKDLETLRHLVRQAVMADSLAAVEQAVAKALPAEDIHESW